MNVHTAPLASAVAHRLRASGKPARIQGAQAYMRTTDPFFGVDAPTLRQVLREFYGTHAPRDAGHCRAQIAELWALREYSKTAPEAVNAFLEAHRDQWSGLTYREARKYVNRPGKPDPSA